MQEKYVTITPGARKHLLSLLAKQPQKDLAIRIHVENPATMDAACCMTFCPIAGAYADDKPFQYDELLVYLDKASTPYLKQATLDYVQNQGEPTLQFNAPFALSKNPEEDALMDNFLENYRRGLVKR